MTARPDLVEAHGELLPKEFRVEVRLRNNRLIRAREELGLTTKAMAEQIGVGYSMLISYENLKQTPLRLNGEWRDAALRIAAFHGLSPGYLWPDSVLVVEKTRANLELSSDDVQKLALPRPPLSKLAPSPEEHVAKAELEREVERALDQLPEREQKALSHRFGLRGETEKNLEETGPYLGGVSRERVRQLEVKALRELRHPYRSKPLLEFFEPDAPGPQSWGTKALAKLYYNLERVPPYRPLSYNLWLWLAREFHDRFTKLSIPVRTQLTYLELRMRFGADGCCMNPYCRSDWRMVPKSYVFDERRRSVCCWDCLEALEIPSAAHLADWDPARLLARWRLVAREAGEHNAHGLTFGTPNLHPC